MDVHHQYLANNEDAYFYIETIDNYLQMSVYTGRRVTTEQFADVIVRITDVNGPYANIQGPFGYATIHITECWMGSVCGLCGEYDHNLENDFMIQMYSNQNRYDDSGEVRNTPKVVAEYLSIENVQRPCDMDEDAWNRTNQFGNSWLDDTVKAKSDQVCTVRLL